MDKLELNRRYTYNRKNIVLTGKNLDLQNDFDTITNSFLEGKLEKEDEILALDIINANIIKYIFSFFITSFIVSLLIDCYKSLIIIEYLGIGFY